MYCKFFSSFAARKPALNRMLPLLPLLAVLLLQTDAGAALPVTGRPDMQTVAPSGRIVLKLAPDSGLVMAADGLTVRPGAKAAVGHAGLLLETIHRLVPGARLEKRIPAARVLPLDKSRNSLLPDLALYAHFQTGTTDRQRLLKIAAELAAQATVELAFLEPVAVPAALGFSAGADPADAGPTFDKGPVPPTPDFQDLQGYLAEAPLGVGALAMRSTPGQRGSGVTVIDVEGAWLWDHEDLPDPVADLGSHIDELAWRNHGTAVMGEIRGQDNGFGVVGITPDCQVGNSSIGGSNTAAALAAAIQILAPGDLILIELHAPGPFADGNGQHGYLPMEYWQDNFDAIRLAASKGIIVCEAAGNGYQDLDDPAYLGLFDRQVRDSGAILCGATAGSDLVAADFSNHGQRVDLNGWGWYVTTCGYGDLQGDELEEEFYTEQFSGTSSASPIVTGSVASLQGMVRQLHGFDLDARLARDLLRQTGTEMDSGHLIGTRPNLEAAYVLAADVGELSGTVTDQADASPLAGILVQVAGSGSFTVTDDSGHWRLPLQSGPVTLEFTSFFHYPLQQTTTVTAGQTLALDVALQPLPLIDLTGVVRAEDLAPLAGVVLTPINQPIDGAVSGPDGSFTISSVPAGYVYRMRWDGLPGYGAQVLDFNTGGFTADAVANPLLPVVSEDFESGPGGFTPAGEFWTLGAPPAEITGGAFDGSQCWGVGMDGDYGDDESDQLLSPVYDLGSIPGPAYRLSFHFYCASEPGFDGVNLEASSDGETFVLLQPLGGYTDLSMGGLGNAPGWSGDSGRWRGAVFDISQYLGGDFQFRLNWGSDAGVTGQGFYVDGIAFGSENRLTPAPEEIPAPAGAMNLKTWPNPFNPRVTIEFDLRRPGPVQVTIYDLRGRKIRCLLDGPVAAGRTTATWDGRDMTGRSLASGVYLVAVTSTCGPPAISRVVLSK